MIMSAVVAVGVAVVTLVGCGGDVEKRKRQLLESGNKYFDRGRYEEASILYRRALQQDQRFGEAYYRLGLTLSRLGQHQRAAGAYVRAFELEPTNLDAFRRLAEFYLIGLSFPIRAQRDLVLNELIEQTARAEEHNPGAAEVVYIRGRTALVQGNRGEAIRLLRQASEMAPDDREMSGSLVSALIEDGQYEEAERLAKGFLEKAPADGRFYDVLYLLYARQQRTGEAEAILKRKCEEQPAGGACLAVLAMHYHSLGQRDRREAVIDRLTSEAEQYPDGLVIAGDFFVTVREFDRAIGCYQEAVRRHPRRKREFEYRILRAYALSGRHEDAEREIAKLLEDSPDDVEALALRGTLRLRRGGTKEILAAISDLEAAVARAPDNAVLRQRLGEAHLANNDLFNAQVQFREALQLKPEYLEPKYSLIDCHLARKAFTQAELVADQVLETHPYDPAALLGRAVARMGLRQYDKAKADLETLRERRQREDEVLFQLGMLDLLERDYGGAEKRFRELAEKYPSDPRGLQSVVNIYLGRGRTAEAQRILEQELRKTPDHLGMRMALAEIAVFRRDYDRAVAELEKVIERQADHGLAHARLGEILLVRGRRGEAMRHLRRAMEASPPVARAFRTAGSLIAQEGRWREGQALLERAIELAPDDPVALNNLAYLLAEAGGDLDRALTYAQRARARAPDNPEFADTLGLIYVKRNLSRNAVELLQEIVKRHPRRASYRYHLALALFQEGKIGLARAELEEALKSKPPEGEAQRIRDLLAQMGS